MAPLESERVHDLLAPVVDGAGYVLETVGITSAGRRRVVRVVVDLPADAVGGLDLDAVADVSRVVSDALDSSDVLGSSSYVLEVGSPGVDRPLTERRHWSRARGRLVTAPLVPPAEQAQVTGRVLDVGDDGVLLDSGGEQVHFGWDRLGPGQVQVEFNRPLGPQSREEA